MAIFTADEVFQIAAELERKGEDFYEALAAAVKDKKIGELCGELATQEREHAKTFDGLRRALTQRKQTRPLSWDELSFAQMLVEERVLPDPDQARELVAQQGVLATLNIAIQFEKDSILFYQEIVPVVDEPDRQAVDRIVQQEKLHAQRLQQIKRQMTG